MLLLLFLAAGLLVGWARGGRMANLGRLPLRHGWLALLALATQVATFSPLPLPSPDLQAAFYLASNLILFVAVALNFHLGGMRLLGLGLAGNALVIGLNGGYMPVSPAAQRMAGLEERARLLEERGSYMNTVILTEETRLPFLGDVVPWPLPFPFRNVYSLGDFLIGFGGFWLAAAGMRRGPPSQGG